MKKILHISKYYYPFVGGVEKVARDVVNSLKDDAEQKVICFNHLTKSKDEIDNVDGIEIIRCGQDALISSQAISFSYKKQLRNALKNFQPDIVIFHYPNPFVSHYLLKYIDKRTTLITYWHLDIYKQKILSKFFVLQNKHLLERSKHIIATSPNYIKGSKWLSKYQEKCVVIPCCIDEDRLKENDNTRLLSEQIKKEGKIICLAVGRHVPYKGFDHLINASNYLDNRFEIRITGKGPETDRLKALANGSNKIKFLGLVSNEDLIANLSACDIYCFSSITKNEAFGIALAEGMYFGKPAVTFTIPGSGVNYVNLDKITGIEVPNSDDKGYANALITLADDKKLREKYGNAAKERVKKKFLYSEFKSSIRNLILIK